MHFIRPTWLTHGGEKKDFEVYSCHVSPDGTRLVTAAGDGHVRIWSTEAIYNVADPTFTQPKQLASMSYHSGTIHTVRFSSNGRFLASGADDKIVCVYTLDPSPPSHAATFGTNEAPPVENWRIFRRLIGHDNDVQDLGWSYDSSILVSVGLDSKVVVWSGHTFEKLKTISSHLSHVKGLTFDPANKYFATASDDRTIKIFRFTPPGPNSSAHDQTNNFMLEKSITAPFAASPLTTYFRRCSWSPDGNHIAAANAVNGPVSSVAIINRGTWEGDIHLIGHEGPVEVCAFSPRLFSKMPIDNLPRGSNGQPMSQFVTVIACAGQDKGLSIWITSNPRPLLITQDLAVKSLSDLAWSPDGRNLFVTSLDGSIIAVIFGENELGYSVSLDENEKALAKFGAGRRGAGIIEGPSALLLEERSREGELRGVEGRMGALMGDSTRPLEPATNGGAPSVQPTALLSNGLGISNGQISASRPDGATPNNNAQGVADPHAAELERLKHRVTITKDGKKRIAPLTVSSLGAGESSLPRSQLMASASQSQGSVNDVPATVLDLSKPFDGLPKGGLAALVLGNKRKLVVEEGEGESRIAKRIAMASQNGAVPILSNTVDGLTPVQPRNLGAGQTTPEFIRPAVTNPSLLVSQVRLAVPKVRTKIVQNFPSGASSNGQSNGIPRVPSIGIPDPIASTNLLFEARNPTGPSATGRSEDREPSRLAVTKNGQPVWHDFLPRSVLLVTGNTKFWVAACEDGSVYTWSAAGRRTTSPIILESQPVILESTNRYMLCITAVGMCYLFDMELLTSPHPPVSLAPILDIATHNLQANPTKAPAITSARLTSEGKIIVTLNNGDGFAYSSNMYTWQRLSEVWWAVGSQYWNSTDSSIANLTSSSTSTSLDLNTTNVGAGVVPYLEKSTTNETLVRGRAYFLQRLVKQLLSREGFEALESSVSIGHLENRIAAALMLGSKGEFQTYLYMYARRLGAEGLKGKVKELLAGLLDNPGVDTHQDTDGSVSSGSLSGPLAQDRRMPTGDRQWANKTGYVCGWPKMELLRGVVLILGKHRDLQRITVPYARLLGITDVQLGADDVMAT